MGPELVEVCWDGRFGRWKVDRYERDGSGFDLFREEHGQHRLKDDAVSQALDVAALRNALLRVEQRDGSEDYRARPGRA